MNDLTLIEQKYSKLGDSELLKLWEENHKYKKEVVAILKSQLESRNLNFENIELEQSDNDQTFEPSFNEIQNKISQTNQLKSRIKEDVKYYVERNQTKEFILKKLSERYGTEKKEIEEIFKSQRKKGTLFIISGILFAIPTILRSIIVGNSNFNPNMGWDLIYIFSLGIISLILIYAGYNIKKKHK